ncbi:hypothetical protein GCM10025865_01300 [Paraoerskovia sediminicola]|uniref:Minor tail protein n=1 Tax=Paraoerskovia sediminicola TaxID=1138587 RepID=A0ABM8FYT3_9CELL|nr:hypothetical protein [Paraoerskovia sediminicola]BDZ40831.1 hypothetical protein GCM10025865_01300 [Paraoerskovia sediminicola]
MAQTSGPLAGQNFTDKMWRTIVGAEPSIVGDVNGLSYSITLPTSSDDALLGTPGQDSASVVAGFGHQIEAGTTESLTIPPVVTENASRTDLIVVRYDPAYTTVPGPCRLYRIPGVEGSSATPSYNATPGGIEDMPLWAVTRTYGQSLNQATKRDLRVRTGPKLHVLEGNSMPTSVPIGTIAHRGGYLWERVIDNNGSVSWTQTVTPAEELNRSEFLTSETGWAVNSLPAKMVRDGTHRSITVEMFSADGNNLTSSSTGNIADQVMFRLKHASDRPAGEVNVLIRYRYVEDGSPVAYGYGVLRTDGACIFTNLTPGIDFNPSGSLGASPSWDVQMSMSYSVAP